MINEAELPLNSRGAVYHLDLTPDDIADTIITVGDPARVAMVSRQFDHLDFKTSHREFVTHTGFVGNKRLTVMSTGIGMPNIEIVMNELDALAKIDLTTRQRKSNQQTYSIVRLGTTGAIHPDYHIGDIIRSVFAVGLDNMMDFYQRTLSAEEESLEQTCSRLFVQYNSSFFVSQCDPALNALFAEKSKPGLTITCNGFYAAQGRSLGHPLRFPQLYQELGQLSWDTIPVSNLEMETAALYALARLMGHRCLSLSTVLANRTNGRFADNIESSVDHMIQTALSVLNGTGQHE